MNILDENILEDQRQLLSGWRVPFRQVGYEVGRTGMKDDEVIPLLLGLRRPTFFTHDAGFFKSGLCHSRYCLVYLHVEQEEAATFLRRLLRHPELNTQAKRMGLVIRLSHAGLSVWRLHAEEAAFVDWLK